MKILLFKGRGFVSWLIRFQTRSKYSHVAIVVGDWLYEAWQGAGVRKVPYAEHVAKNGGDNVDVFRLDPGLPFDEAAALAYLEARVGKGYDYWGVIRFVTRRRMPANDKEFCSEYGFSAVLSGGVQLFRDTEPYEVSPGLFGRSPLLKPA
jgi:uncharacterized protein YycO